MMKIFPYIGLSEVSLSGFVATVQLSSDILSTQPITCNPLTALLYIFHLSRPVCSQNDLYWVGSGGKLVFNQGKCS